jgi:hypothetical protein
MSFNVASIKEIYTWKSLKSGHLGGEKMKDKYKLGQLIYDNPLSCIEDVKGFRLEGEGEISFNEGRLRIRNTMDDKEGQKSNLVYWCPENFPENIAITWEFMPIREPGLCVLFFAAKGMNGEDIFDPVLKPREGLYDQYHHGDIDALHISYFRRKDIKERAFNICNLRKSHGFHLVCHGADPIPSVENVVSPYHIKLIKFEKVVAFYINDLQILKWEDDGDKYGKVLGEGKIGFRQMAPLIAEYANFKVYSVEEI